jgi:predicted alpha/beta-fold hydrolase
MQFRGCSGEANRLARSYHSGDTQDLRFLLENLVRRYPERAVMAVGYSLGGNVLLKYLGETGAASVLRAAAAVSVPYDLSVAATRLDRGLSKFYQWHLVRSLRRKVREKFARMAAPIALDRLAQWNSFWSYDEHVTAPLHGFKGADDYYVQSSCRRYLESIVSPTLLVHARNDPFLYPDAIPQQHELPESITLYTVGAGGHVGFVAGRNPFKPRYWIDDCLMTWFSNRLGN